MEVIKIKTNKNVEKETLVKIIKGFFCSISSRKYLIKHETNGVRLWLEEKYLEFLKLEIKKYSVRVEMV